MRILKAKLESGIGRAEEYRLLGKNHPEGLNVHIQYIKDLTKPLIDFLRLQLTPDVEAGKLFAAASTTLKNLRIELATAESGVICPAISRVREKLEISSGQKLPTFDGNLAQFHKFLTSFSFSVNKDPSISDAEKLIILKSCLIGEPLNFVDAFPTSSRNYSLALKLLNDVYGSSPRNVAKLYQSLNELPQISMNDRAKFRETCRQLESILQSMGKYGVDVNEDLCLKFLYLRKFDERTLFAAFVEQVKMSLPEIRREIRRLISVDELYLQVQVEDSADNVEVSVPSEERPTVSQISSNGSANIEGLREIAGTAVNGNKSITTKRNIQKKSPTLTSRISCEQNSVEQFTSEAFEMSLPTLCANAICTDTNKRTSIRLLFQNDVKISLMTEDAAKRLGIRVPSRKTLRLCTSDLNFTATVEKFYVDISTGSWDNLPVRVHIVDDNFSTQDVPVADIDDFIKRHPELSHLKLPDTGKGRPVDVFLCGHYYKQWIQPHSYIVKPNWQLQKNVFGWLVQGPVKKSDRQISYSYRFPENYEVPYSELACQHI